MAEVSPTMAGGNGSFFISGPSPTKNWRCDSSPFKTQISEDWDAFVTEVLGIKGMF